MERNPYWGNIKAIAIFAVVIGHFVEWSMPKLSPAFKALFIFIYSFHMPVFIFVCGFFHSNSKVVNRALFGFVAFEIYKAVYYAMNLAIGATAEFSFLQENYAPWFLFVYGVYAALGYLLRNVPNRMIFAASIFLGGA